jgi:soluble epoxide hydrolase/lipid-phosphate phosphatase
MLSYQYIHAAGPFVPIAYLVPALPRLSYQLFFDQQTEAAIAELNKDIRRTLRATLRTSTSLMPPGFLTNPNSFMAEWDEFSEVRTTRRRDRMWLRNQLTTVPQIPPIQFFTPHEEDYMVEQFSIQKFDHSLFSLDNTCLKPLLIYQLI